jgi:hypothetical protein
LLLLCLAARGFRASSSVFAETSSAYAQRKIVAISSNVPVKSSP